MNDKTKRLTHNTLYLVFRSMLIMVISLITSRVVLDALGAEGYGTYNVVATFIVLFSFLGTMLQSASDRYLSYYLGKEDTASLQNTFSATLITNLVLVGLVVLVGETIGLYFVIHRLKFPPHLYDAALIVYHISIATVCLNIMRIPFLSAIVAHEKMDFYAYISIGEAVMKILIALLLLLSLPEKLILYAWLILASSVVWLLAAMFYCKKKFPAISIRLSTNRKSIREMLSFSGWNFVLGLCDTTNKQGAAFMLDIFFGVLPNAALGITNLVRNAVYSFVVNINMAANPQIVKEYANGNLNRMKSVFFGQSKFGFYCVLLFAIPLLMNLPFVLEIWLKNPPQYALEFVTMTLILMLFDALFSPVYMAIVATGRLKVFFTIDCILQIGGLVALYVAFRNGAEPQAMYYLLILITLSAQTTGLILAQKYFDLRLGSYARNVILPTFLVAAVVSVIAFMVRDLMTNNWLSLFVGSAIVDLMAIGIIWKIGLTSDERQTVKSFIHKKKPQE